MRARAGAGGDIAAVLLSCCGPQKTDCLTAFSRTARIDRLQGYDARPVCALIASMRTRFQISSTLSMKPLFLKIAGSLLSNLVSTIALMRPGRADITATRSAR